MSESNSSAERVIVKFRYKDDHPFISLDELGERLSSVQDNRPCYVSPANGSGISYLRFATNVFSRLVELRRPCLNVVIRREAPNGNGEYSKVQVLAAKQWEPIAYDIHSSDEADDAWLPVSSEGYEFGDGSADFYNKYDVVAVGGTFDRLHAGHRLLLTAASWAARKVLTIGITGNVLLQNKAHKDLIASFDERSRAAVSYAQQVKPALSQIFVAELTDPAGPTATEPSIDALVVSRETARGAEIINEGRVAIGLQPMTLIVVDVLDTKEEKLSSSALRAAEFRKAKLCSQDSST